MATDKPPAKGGYADRASAGRADTPTRTRLSREEMFEVLGNRRRRYVVHCLQSLGPGEITTLQDVASQVTAWEQGMAVEEVTYGDRKSVQTALSQCHLPKLDETGIIEYDQSTNTVRATAGAERIDLFLEMVTEDSISWSVVLVGLSTLATLWAVVLATGVVSTGVLSAAGWFVVVAVVFLVAATAFAYDHRHQTIRTQTRPP